MGLTKQYLRYSEEATCGLVGTGTCIRFVTRFSERGKFIVASACEYIIIWDLRKRTKVLSLNVEGLKATVTSIEVRPPAKGTLDNTHIAVGYSDGTLALFETKLCQPVKFSGHSRAVSSIAWDKDGMRVASGSEDGEIVLWDVVSEKGIVRLRGHTGWITKVCFMSTRNVLVSSGRDSHIKFWNLDTYHCFRTLSAHRTEVWDFILLKDDTRLVSGSTDAELRVWSLNFAEPHTKDYKLNLTNGQSENVNDNDDEKDSKHIHLDIDGDMKIGEEAEVENDASNLGIEKLGSILRTRGDRVQGLVTDGRTVCCYGKSQVADLYVILTEAEVTAKLAKRLKKAQKRARKDNIEGQGDITLDDNISNTTAQLSDEIKRLPSFKAQSKLNAIDISTSRDDGIKLSCLLNDNSIVYYGADINIQGTTTSENSENNLVELNHLKLGGHHGEMRCILFNSVADQIVTAGADAIKVWSRVTATPLLDIKCSYALSMVLPPGDRHVLIGTREGHLQMFDLGSGAMLEDLQAHESNESDRESGVWSLALKHDGRGFVSAGSDCLIKFWTFELVEDLLTGKGKRLSFVQDSKALKAADQVTCVRCSVDGKFIAISTLDMKETIYYMDSLKLFHELYGHSMPSTCFDFSHDSTIIVTGGKDSSVRIYGTDFGDQRKLLNGAHPGGVTDVKFIPGTHLFFTCGMDSKIKQWDADNFQRITTISKHHGIVRCLSISSNGKFLVSAGQDKSIRLWRRTDELLVLEEERENERTKQEEEQGLGAIQRPVIPGETSDAGAVRPTRTTVETEKAVDQLIEALAIYRNQRELGKNAEPHYLMQFVYKTTDPLKFLLLVLKKIKSSELEESILILPLHSVLTLLVAIKSILERGWNVELVSRVAIVALRVNLAQLVASPLSKNVLKSLSELLVSKLQNYQDTIGCNLAGLTHLKDRQDQRSESQTFVEAAGRLKEQRRKTKKKQRQIQRKIMAI